MPVSTSAPTHGTSVHTGVSVKKKKREKRKEQWRNIAGGREGGREGGRKKEEQEAVEEEEEEERSGEAMAAYLGSNGSVKVAIAAEAAIVVNRQ